MMVDGANLYEASRDGRDTSETGAGKAMVRKLINRVTDAIEAMQKSVASVKAHHTRKAALIAVPAETLALIVLTVMIDKCYCPEEPALGSLRSSLAKAVGEKVEFELSFRTWVADSKEAAKAYAKDNGLPSVPMSQAERIIQESTLSSPSRAGIRRALQKVTEYKWTPEERLICGDALVFTVVKALPDCFETSLESTATSVRKFDRMLPAMVAQIDRLEIARGLNKPSKRPMLTPPRKWVASVL